VTSTFTARAEKRVIVALDVETADEARSIVSELRGEAAAFKVGLQLFASAGPGLVRELAKDNRVFLDLKFHDIPNTVARAGIEAARLGVWMFNVHASGGSEMMRQTSHSLADACARENLARPLLIGVTVLTSFDTNTLVETGIEGTVADRVLSLARLTAECGLDGVVASPLEVATVRAGVDKPGFCIVTPGVRSESATKDDQKRVTTAGRAASEGADYLVIGRPILRAPDRLSALRQMQDEIEAVG
jgi:orotidine-5'-phosphate decarboxylase